MAFSDESPDLVLKIILVGNSSVGKSCLLRQLVEGSFDGSAQTTVGVNYGAKILNLENKVVKLQIWDTAGQEAFRAITRSFYKGAIAAFLVYDLTRRTSFESMKSWLQEIKAQSGPEIMIYMLGNMIDLEHRREVKTPEAMSFVADNRLEGFYEVSAKTGHNVSLAFEQMAKDYFKKLARTQRSPDDRFSVSSIGTKAALRDKAKNDKKNKCCK